LISADIWGKYYYKLIVDDRKEFLGKNQVIGKRYR